MDTKRFQNLRNRKWVSQRLQEFLKVRGKASKDLAGLTDLTNINNYMSGKALPTWPALVALVEACETDLETLMRHFDPAIKAPPANQRHLELQRKLYELLNTTDAARDWPGSAETNVDAVYVLYQQEKGKKKTP